MDYQIDLNWIKYKIDNKNNIYATIDDGITVLYQDNNWIESFPYWILGNNHLYKDISLEDVLEITNNDPFTLLNLLFVNYLKEKEDKDYFKKFIKYFLEFVKDDYYKMFHNKNKDLIYSAKELDIHYENCGYIDMFNQYYEEYLIRKNESLFSYLDIQKIEDDYIIKVKKLILNNEELL